MATLTGVEAQNVSVEQKIDSVGILIGEQAHMTVTVTAREGAQVVFPEWKPKTYLVPGVELLAIEKDTAQADDGQVSFSQRLTVTSFDENLYALPPVEVKVDGKPYKGEQLALKVITVDVDTLHPNEFFPPKDVQDNPFLWSEWSRLFWLSVLVVVLCLAAVWLLLRLKANKPIIASIRIIKKILPHQRAMKAIDQIKADHMTASEDQKEYYTRLTDTLRQYINERFGFNAMEMTTPEIIYNLQQSGDQTMIGELKDLFETADLVKFAKYSTLMGENDRNLVNAINFIDQTKVEGQPTEERVEPQLSDDDKKTQQNRLVIKTLLGIIAVAVVAVVVYVAYSVIQLL
ncbi:MAG: hypothetical protein IJ605_00525 [Prevotella sp.]|nr:hypothetical protein [Prevotella sp.]